MAKLDAPQDPRRRILIEALALGAWAASQPLGAQAWSLFGSKPAPLPEGRSIHRITGTAMVNGKAATVETPVVPGDVIETGANSVVVFAVGGHAMLLRSNARLELDRGREGTDSLLVRGLRLLSGALLSVSRNAPMEVATTTATIGIRGTGWYAEADPEQTYFCTCYGVADIASSADGSSRETVEARHHDRPLYIIANAPAGAGIRDAPFKNHTDEELMLIEALVGREPPFVFPKDDYSGPRRDY